MRKSKKITNCARVFITTFIWILFIVVWIKYYNGRAFRSHQDIGLLGTSLLWLWVYLWFCDLFKAFSIASSSIFDIIISQLICVGLTDGIAYVAVCFLARGWEAIIPGFVCFVFQVVVLSVVVCITKQVLLRKMIPSKTLVIYGGTYELNSTSFFCERLLAKYKHMFEITQVIAADSDNIFNLIEDNEQIIMVGVLYETRKAIAKTCIDLGKTFYFIPDVEELIFENCVVKNLLDTPMKRYYFVDSKTTYYVLKRLFDFIFAIVMLIITFPIIFIAAVAIKIEDGGPIFFRQLRVTKDGKLFNILKLRSMIVDADKYGVKMTTVSDKRVTKVGAFIRMTRIDELPQLLNIIKGDMSIVGPRPERIENVKKYESELPAFKYRHMVRGGLTGYAQVYGKYNTNAEDKLRLDLLYIMNASLFMDIKIFLLTFRTIFQKESTDGFEVFDMETTFEGASK